MQLDWELLTDRIAGRVDPPKGSCFVIRNTITGRVLAKESGAVRYFPNVEAALRYRKRHHLRCKVFPIEWRRLQSPLDWAESEEWDDDFL